MSRRFVIITPCRDEAQYLEEMTRSVAAQTIQPTLWVIVDDGSTDRTPEILEKAAREHDWIRVVRREDRGKRAVGPGVIEAFYAGLETVDLKTFDYVGKFDADLILPPRYFERLFDCFEDDPWLGNMSGKVYIERQGGQRVLERRGDENAIGPAKMYRVQCFKDIGGFVRQVSWDGIDGHLCRMNGWVAKSEDLPELRILHRRQTGSSECSIWHGRLRWGRGKWFMGSAWYYVLAVGVYRMCERPYFISGAGILVGYFRAMLRGLSRYNNPEYRRHLRRFELQCLLLGKSRTARRYHERIRSTTNIVVEPELEGQLQP